MENTTAALNRQEVCPAGFLSVLSYYSRREGEVPCEAPTDEDDDLPTFAAFKQKMGNQGVATISLSVEGGVGGCGLRKPGSQYDAGTYVASVASVKHMTLELT